ncbi:MAG: hypothetical protein RLZZ519_2606 [Bacteroidota bacterium]|jgi:hypothetical protein
MPKRKFDKLRDNEAIEREKRWRKQRMRSRREGKEEIEEGFEKWSTMLNPMEGAANEG